MKFTTLTTATLLLPSLSSALTLPSEARDELVTRDTASHILDTTQILEKRRGGGGGGGKGGGSTSGGSSSSGSSSGGSSSSGSSSGGSSSSGSSSGGSSSSGSSSGGGRGSTGVSGGGSTSASPKYGGSGSSYAGGATSPYRAGGRSASGITPILAGSALGLGAGALLFAGHPFYYYPYSHPYYYNNNGRNDSLPVSCVCAEYNPCGCDDGNNNDLVKQQIDDGTANITTVNGTRTVVVNGTLENGTDTGSTTGGTSSSTGGAAGLATSHLGAAVPVALMAAAMIWGF